MLHFLRRHILHFDEECGCPVVIDFAVLNFFVFKMVRGAPNHGFYIALPLLLLKGYSRMNFIADIKFGVSQSRIINEATACLFLGF